MDRQAKEDKIALEDAKDILNLINLSDKKTAVINLLGLWEHDLDMVDSAGWLWSRTRIIKKYIEDNMR